MQRESWADAGRRQRIPQDAKEVEITNVSYDPTRELYEAYNALFAEHWKAQTG
ncbi:MAG: hypothetical protein V8T24_07395 [Roseburia hominis]